ncbi:MAG TPA: hypothetical protein VFG07_09885, partial [Thermoplasmata archaeon]|nr:hypothetical protein [Thermoplasmata archaeon]
TAPAGVLTDLNLRQFLIHAFPYTTTQSSIYTENGTQWRFPYGGGGIPLYASGAVPANVSWANGDPVASTAVPGSAGWWWNLTTHDNTTGTSCSTLAPCSIPLAYDQNDSITASTDALWSRSVANLSGGAIQLTLVPVDFFTLIVYGYFAPPGQNPFGVWPLGWVNDYPDPSDSTTPLYFPDSQYTFPNAVAEAFYLLNHACSSSFSTYSGATTPIPYDCQGAAYNASVALFQQADGLSAGFARDLAYAEAEQIAERLGLYVAQGQVNAVTDLAPWVDPATLNSNPWLGGAAQTWYSVRLRTIPATPLSVEDFVASPSSLAEGQLLTLSVTLTGGTGTRSFLWSGLPPGCSTTSSPVLQCRPTSGGNFTVHVAVSDQAGGHAGGNATVEVSGLSITSFTATPSSIRLGSSATLQVQLGGGAGTPRYVYSGLPPGCASQDVATLLCQPNGTGHFTVQVAVTVGTLSARDTTPLDVLPPLPSIGAFVASRTSVDLGDVVTFTVNGSAGAAPYNVSFTGTPGCSQVVTAAVRTNGWTASLTCTPAGAGTYAENATMTDAAGQQVSAQTALTVNPLPSVASFSASTSAIDVGTMVTLTALAAGGTLPSTWSYSGLPSGCTSANTSQLTCVPTSAGAFTVTTRLVDADGHGASAQLRLSIQPALSIALFYADPSQVSPGEITNLTLRTSGGTLPLTVAYSGLPSSCPAANTSLLVCIPTTPGSYTVGVTVTDRAGAIVNTTTPLTVSAPTEPPTGGSTLFGLPLTTGLAVLAVVVGVVAVIAVALLLRRRPPQVASEEAPPDSPSEAPVSADPEAPSEEAPGPG